MVEYISWLETCSILRSERCCFTLMSFESRLQFMNWNVWSFWWMLARCQINWKSLFDIKVPVTLMLAAYEKTPLTTPEHVILAESGAKTTRDLEFEAQKVFPQAKIYFPKINIPFDPSQRNYLKFKKVNDAILSPPYHCKLQTKILLNWSFWTDWFLFIIKNNKYIIKCNNTTYNVTVPYVTRLHKETSCYNTPSQDKVNNLWMIKMSSVLLEWI